MVKSFKHQIQIKFHQADTAGVMYFAHIFSIAHDCLELFVQASGYSWEDYFLGLKIKIPLRHAECDYQRPFFVGQVYDVHIEIAHFSTSSFQVRYLFKKEHDLHAIVKTVHTCLDAKTYQKIKIPTDLKEKFLPFLKEISL